MLRPPRLLGREAFNQYHSESGLPAKSARASRMISKEAVACLMWHGGHVRMEKATLGKARHGRRRAVSICESSMSGNFDRISFTFPTLFNVAVSQKSGGPMGQPNRLKPSLVMGISGGRGCQWYLHPVECKGETWLG